MRYRINPPAMLYIEPFRKKPEAAKLKDLRPAVRASTLGKNVFKLTNLQYHLQS